MAGLQVAADLCFSVERPGRAPVTGTLTGSDNRIELRLSDPAHFAGGRDAARLRRLATSLAASGLVVIVLTGDRVLLEVGATASPWWQRPLTRSRHLRVASARGALTGALGRLRRPAAALPGRDLLPPTTPWPIAPTFRQSERPVTTTHDPRRGGNPRLVLTAGNDRLPGDRRIVFPLRQQVTSIGSDEACEIRLAGLDPVHAVVIHDERDELVVEDRSDDGTTLVNGLHAGHRVLRTGARVQVGPWTLSYRRAEYADHGRPFGGRIGGELGHQRSQPDPRTVDSVRPTGAS